ncbi:glycosyltransferase family 4 protein [Ruegeria halocynthiae]|uniref:glycosyltransferase family 4 protein n=1 Tax=Ruegeria halocynthiae TaxID=985054 RepID=UPI00126880AE|nr:glycosyltransferase family 4 protein [Ruegeria halocynthiae]
MTTPSTPRVIVIGPLPPPHNGAAKNTKIWAEAFEARNHEVLRLETNVQSGSAHNRSLRYHMHRVHRTLKNALTLLTHSNPKTVIYMVPDGGMGLMYNLLYAAIFRLRGVQRIFLHHRNFFNIRTGNNRLRKLCDILGDRARHIFLTDRMRDTFERQFGPTVDAQVISNAATCDITALSPDHVVSEGKVLTIGFLSNLNADKGFDIVVDAFEALANQLQGIQFLIGGQPTDDQAVIWRAKLEKALGDQVTFLGHVSGGAKADFYKASDVFVFPSTYKLEAQPNVLMEALSAGASVVSTDHACIPETLDGAHHRLVSLSDDRSAMARDITAAVAEVIAEMQDREAHLARARQNITAFEKMQREGTEAYQTFFATKISQVS